MTNVIERLGKYAGLDFDKQRTPSNPCITVREAIEVADHIATLTAKLAESQAEALKYKLATEKNADALRECQRDAADLTKILANQQTEHAKQLAESESAVEQWKCNSRENKLIAEQAARELAGAQRDADELKQLLRRLAPTLPIKQQASINDAIAAMARSAD